MREIKFRAWDNDKKEMVDWEYLIGYCDIDYLFGNHGHVPDFDVMQYTGLHDATKWEDLSETEKREFYNKYRSEDGLTIKYINVEDVRHLWQGREIYEGDILKYNHSKSDDDNLDTKHYARNYVVEHISTQYRYGCRIRNKSIWSMVNQGTIYNGKAEKIGNIHENPELLEGETV